MNYIGISEERLQHMLGVARKAYQISIDMQLGQDFAFKMFILGYVHDVGYEFVTENQRCNHSDMSALLLAETGMDVECLKAVQEHGRYSERESLEWKILNMADMQVDSQGNEVSVSQRLDDIKNRYGEHSDQYLTACDVCYRIGLTAINFATNIE